MDVLSRHGLTDCSFLNNSFTAIAERHCTNQFMLQLHSKSKELAPGDSLSRIISWISAIFSIPERSINANGVKSKLQRVINELKKKRGEGRETFLKERFIIPTSTVVRVVSQNEQDVGTVLAEELIGYQSALVKAESQLVKKRKHISEITEEKKQLKRKLERKGNKEERSAKKAYFSRTVSSKLSTCRRNLELKDKKLMVANHANKQLRFQQKKHEKQLKEKSLEIESLKKDVEMVSSLISDSEKEIQIALDSKKGDVEEIRLLKEENTYLQSLVEDNRIIATFDEERNCFNPKMVECVMNITNCNVAANNVSEVISHVCELCNKTPQKLPSERTVNRINLRKADVAQKQLEHIAEESNLTLYTDETSKFGRSYEVFAVTDEKQNSYLLGLREMMNKSSSTVLETLKEIINDIDVACQDSSTKAGQKILTNVKNTMSDRAATEKKFQELLESYRLQLLPNIIQGWDEMAEEERNVCSRMNNFFCGLHLLVGCADVASVAVKKFEQLHNSDPADTSAKSADQREKTSPEFSKSESGTVRLIRCTSKAFGRGADEKSGVHGAWKTYVEAKGEKVLFYPFKHNRFNVVFLLGGVVYYHRNRIVHFLENVHGVTNRLLEQISTDIKDKGFLAGCRAFGLVSKQITAPLWRFIEGGIHILEMNKQYLDLCEFLEKVKDDSSVAMQFVHGDITPFDSTVDDSDAIHKELTRPCEGDGLASEVVQVLCESILTLLKRQLADQLPGGKYASFSEELKLETASLLKHNKLPEFFFGQVDFLLHYRPNASTLCNEAFLMFSHNKTGQWLKSLPENEKNKLLEDSRKNGKTICATFKQRLQEIKLAREERLRQKEAAIQSAREQKLKRKENLTNQIAFFGLWQSETDVDLKLAEIKTVTEKRKALQAQLNFRKNVLLQKSSIPNVFSFSGKNSQGKVRPFPIEKLKQNLKELVKGAFSGPRGEGPELPNQPLLVGKKIQHRFSNGSTYQGVVISTVPGYPRWYNVKYDNDDALYVYDLLLDYEAGDLMIIV